MITNDFPIKELEVNFEKRNIKVLWFDSFHDIKDYLLEQIPRTTTVGIGNSKTLKHMNITKALRVRGNVVYDKSFAITEDEIRRIKRNSLMAEFYISSSNAVSVDGKIINIDHSGNRVAALAYGPDKVYIVVGRNKITATSDDAMKRARNTAAPLNAKRAEYNPPCVSAGYCVVSTFSFGKCASGGGLLSATHCSSAERVCYVVSCIEGQSIEDRMTLLIANEEEGF